MSKATERLKALTEDGLERTSGNRRKQIVADVREVVADRARLIEYGFAGAFIFAATVALIVLADHLPS